ncbi:hypothetical protein J4214_01315 [Candidatus Woesearchaeota archaeon]|nr:hypothetical protein [Candidatus Woesearchaeota archaeon]
MTCLIEKKGQFWYLDLLIALFVILIVAVLFARSIVDIVDREKEIKVLLSEGIDISNSLMSKGLWAEFPSNLEWCKQSYGRIGFVQNSKIINNNFNAFKTLVNTPFDPGNPSSGCQNPGGGSNVDGYKKSKILLGANVDYIIYMQDKDGNIIGEEYYGKQLTPQPIPVTIGNILSAIDADNRINIFRYVYYDEDGDGKGEIIRMGISVWKAK